MLLQLLFSSPELALVWVVAIVLGLTVHEFAHALVGVWRGDNTAERMGRLTLNPMAHLDLAGFIMLLIIGFGWAKPVPFDPRNLRNPLVDGLLIALAGPFSNLLMAGIAGGALRLLVINNVDIFSSLLGVFLVLVVLVNLMLLFFNLIPIHPLDGSKLVDVIFARTRYEHVARWLERYGPQIMLVLVAISLFTQFNPFFFVQVPSFLVCDGVTGLSCGGVLEYYFQ